MAADRVHTFAAITVGDVTTIEARRGSEIAWSAQLAGQGGAIALGRELFVTLGGKTVAGIELRGEPGAAVVALDPTTGAQKWKLAIDSSEWSVIAAIAPAGDGAIVAGSFSGTLRAGAATVSSAGKSDGFVARIGPSGEIVWLERMGGVGPDAIQGVATAGERIAIAGTFAAGADLLGEVLKPYDDKTPRADGFVAELDAKGARRWSQSFGGKLDDSVVGVAIDGDGRVVVAASLREVMKIGSTELIAMGDADGALAYWSKDGIPGHAVQIGGPDFDGVRAIAAVGDRVVVAGFFSGTIRLDQRKLTAGGGDDAFVAAFDNGSIVDVWAVTGPGREEVAALAAMPGGFIAGVTHTAAASIDGEGAGLPSPKDPASGAALVVRGIK